METIYDAYHLVFDDQKKGQFYLGWTVKGTSVQTPVTVKEPKEQDNSLEIIFLDDTKDTFRTVPSYEYGTTENMWLMSNNNYTNKMSVLTLDPNWAKDNNRYKQEQHNNKKADKLVSTFSKMGTLHQKEVLNQLSRIFVSNKKED